MITVTSLIPFSYDEYLRLAGLRSETCVFFDIETTGFRASSSIVYLIGAAYKSHDGWTCSQWMIEDPSEEIVMLRIFEAFLRPYDTLIQFNGDQFDIPYLNERFDHYGMSSPLLDMDCLDLYKSVRPYRHILQLEKLNQKSIETYLGLWREDKEDGGSLIAIFKKFCSDHDPHKKKLLFLHNKEDVHGMISLLPLIAMTTVDHVSMDTTCEAICEKPAHTSNRFSCAKDTHDVCDSLGEENSGSDLVIHFQYPLPFPVRIEHSKDFASLTIEGRQAELRIHICCEELKYFFPDYRSYYYLPAEDMAMHKSVAVYVEPSARCQAKPDTCYVRKASRFLPQPQPLNEPAFKRSRRDKFSYFEWKEDFLSDPVFLHQYAQLILTWLLSK